ncbi:MAG: TRAP transporter large permease subunit [Deltaproteobacteria bacterium]|nr:TRAP transporter large permease subunit [Deltaproteobacteria bacterium]
MPLLFKTYNPGDGSIHFLPGLLERFAIMELDVLIVLSIFALAAVFFITEWIEVELTWRTTILIACMYPMGEAMQQSGADRTLSQLLLSIPGGSTALGALLLIAVLTMMLTQVIHNAVAAVIVTPLALYAAQQTGADPKGFGIAVILAASANFLLPVGHPAPLMIREPGKYAVSDYLKFGVGLMLLTVSAIGLLVPLICF